MAEEVSHGLEIDAVYDPATGEGMAWIAEAEIGDASLRAGALERVLNLIITFASFVTESVFRMQLPRNLTQFVV
jgi:hypothetical protein